LTSALDRETAATAMRRFRTVDEQRQDFTESALLAATGDAVVVACTPTDLWRPVRRRCGAPADSSLKMIGQRLFPALSYQV
jgi:hypothetical protein